MPSSWMNAGLRRRLLGCGRAVGCTSAASVALACCWLGSVSAELERSSFALGDRLAEQLGEVVTAPQRLALNGQELWIASKVTELTVPRVLDRFEAHCVSGAEGPSANRAELEPPPVAAPSLASPGSSSSAAQRTLLRRHEAPGRGGQLVCLAPAEPLTGFLDLGERLRTLFATGELGALGELRYVQARARPEGGSHVVSVWSAGAFNLLDALPRDADVPGEDPEGAPRPPQATRLLSARIPGRSYALVAYASERSAEELLAFYSVEMPKQGWARLDAERLVPETAPLSARAHAYTQGDALTLLVVDDASEAAGATAMLVQVGAPRAARAGGAGTD